MKSPVTLETVRSRRSRRPKSAVIPRRRRKSKCKTRLGQLQENGEISLGLLGDFPQHGKVTYEEDEIKQVGEIEENVARGVHSSKKNKRHTGRRKKNNRKERKIKKRRTKVRKRRKKESKNNPVDITCSKNMNQGARSKSSFSPSIKEIEALMLGLSYIRKGDQVMGRQWLELASKVGNARASYEIAKLSSCNKDRAQWLELAATRGFAKAQCTLAELLLTEKEDDEKLDNQLRALQLLELSAAQGFAHARYILGKLSLKSSPQVGDMVKSEMAAEMWFKMAAELNHIQACCELASMYDRQAKLRQNVCIEEKSFANNRTKDRLLNLSLSYWRRAADLGDAQAQFNVGRIWAQKAMFSGNASGAILGDRGEPLISGKEDDEAVKWFNLACKQVHGDALNEMGCRFWTGGRGVEKSLMKAVEMWEKASLQGHLLAQRNLQTAQSTDGVGIPSGWPLKLRNWNPLS